MNKCGVYNKFADLVDAWIALGFLQLVLTKPDPGEGEHHALRPLEALIAISTGSHNVNREIQ